MALVNNFWKKNFELLTDFHFGCEDYPHPPRDTKGDVPPEVTPTNPAPWGGNFFSLIFSLFMRFEGKT